MRDTEIRDCKELRNTEISPCIVCWSRVRRMCFSLFPTQQSARLRCNHYHTVCQFAAPTRCLLLCCQPFSSFIMSRNVSEENITQLVLDRIKSEDERMNDILNKLVSHTHAFVRDVEPTQEEWNQAIDFLTRTGQKSNDKRQEFILLSDVLGVSMLVDSINHRPSAAGQTTGPTETTVTGPFHAKALPFVMGSNIARGPELERAREKNQETLVSGIITNVDGSPLDGVMIDVWQSDDIGYYDIQDDMQPMTNLRGIFHTGKDGTYWFRTIKPNSYPVPTDGPVGELLRAAGRHPMRPSHIHFMISAPGYERLITHIFSEGDEFLDSDAVFGVKDSLVAPYVPNHSVEDANLYGFKSPFLELKFDFVLKKDQE